jgi:methyl-accepting chemotaxis protein
MILEEMTRLKNMKIGTQIVLITFLVAITAIIGLSVTSVYYFSQFAKNESLSALKQGMTEIKNYIEVEMLRIRMFRDQLGRNEIIAAHVASRDSKFLNAELIKQMKEARIDIVAVADTNGTVISRPHDPNRIGDNIGNDDIVQRALKGENWDALVSGTSTKLGYYCATPVKTKDGQIVGMIRTAFMMDNEQLVDRIKEMFNIEVTLFAGKTRINTTLLNNGKRIVDTDAPPEIQQDVLQDGKDVSLLVKILDKDYIAAYSPLTDPNTGKTMGMYFVGKPMATVDNEIYSMMKTVAAVSIVVFAIAFLFSFFMARRISKPLGQIVHLSERGRNGDLTIKREDFNYSGGGELGALVNALSEMMSAQMKALSQVVLTVNGVTKNTESMSALSGENSSVMTNSANLIKKVSNLCDINAQAVKRSATNVSEMANGADSVANMSTESANSLSKTTEISKVAASSVSSLVSDIRQVDEKTNENQEKIRVLSTSVNEISSFMSVIGSIADQTNLLALNAAIEAARAGETGRGFAVVAEEVRKLAEESRSASKSVENLMANLSQNADEAISASEQSVAIVSKIKLKADTTVEGLNKALAEITNANEAIQSIAAVAEEQAASSSEMSRAIDEIKQSTEDIVRTLTELNQLSERATRIGESVSDSAQHMAQSAVDLKGVLALFKIKE